MNSQPAELSGPSTNPKLQLTALPTEVRLRVYYYALVRDVPLRPKMSRDQYEHLRTSSKSFKHHPRELERFMLEAKESKTKFSNVFSGVSRQIRREAGETFFQNNTVRVFMEDFVYVFTHYHGPCALHVQEIPHPLSHLRHLTIELPSGPMDWRRNSTKAERLQTLFTYSLPGLQTLALVPRPVRDSLVANWHVQSVQKSYHRNLLYQAGVITRMHPFLKEAVWCDGSYLPNS